MQPCSCALVAVHGRARCGNFVIFTHNGLLRELAAQQWLELRAGTARRHALPLALSDLLIAYGITKS